MIFPYRRSLAFTPGGLAYVYRPMIPVLLLGPQGSDLILAMADSGSDDVLFPRGLAAPLGISVDDSRATSLTGFTGHQVTMSPADVELELSDGQETCRWGATVYFVSYPDPQYQMVLFGRSGGLDYFTAAFAGAKKELELLPNGTFPGTVRRP
jgi:hypothetical protein